MRRLNSVFVHSTVLWLFVQIVGPNYNILMQHNCTTKIFEWNLYKYSNRKEKVKEPNIFWTTFPICQSANNEFFGVLLSSDSLSVPSKSITRISSYLNNNSNNNMNVTSVMFPPSNQTIQLYTSLTWPGSHQHLSQPSVVQTQVLQDKNGI